LSPNSASIVVVSDAQIKRFIVGVDGSAGGAAALRWAVALAAGVGAEVLAVNAYQHPYAEISPEEHERQVDERRALLNDEWVRPVGQAGVSVLTKVQQGDARDIMAIAEDEGADLVVLGRTGQGGSPGFIHLGSVVEYVAHHSRLPLAIIPPYVSGSIERVILGVDGSVESSAAIAWCVDHVGPTNAEIVAVTVREPYLEWTPRSTRNSWRGDIELEMKQWIDPISATGVAVTPIVERDRHPANCLLGVASARQGDLLVIGTRGAGGFTGLRLGGVAMKVMHGVAIPLVLVPPSG